YRCVRRSRFIHLTFPQPGGGGCSSSPAFCICSISRSSLCRSLPTAFLTYLRALLRCFRTSSSLSFTQLGSSSPFGGPAAACARCAPAMASEVCVRTTACLCRPDAKVSLVPPNHLDGGPNLFVRSMDAAVT